MYLWKILHVEKKELIYRVYQSQKVKSHPGDWIRMLDKDRETLFLDITDKEIENLSKFKFKRIIKMKVEEFALREMNLIKVKRRKSDYLHSSSFETAKYLLDERFSKLEAQLLFKLRSKTLNLKMNFPSQHSNLMCKVCKLFPESQSHLLQCPQIVEKLQLLSLNKKIDENHIYGNVEKQEVIVKLYMQIMKIRSELLDEEESL